MTLTGQTLNKWTIDSMKKAAAEFEVPEDTKILLIFPEVFDRDILLKDPRYTVNNMGRKGVKTPCPWCLSNKLVKFKDKSGYKAGQHRNICGYRGRTPIYGFILECDSSTCIGNPTKVKNDGKDNE
jgi:hypothetical protein